MSTTAMSTTWLLLRILRWASWIAFLATCFYVSRYRADIVSSFGQLPLRVELLIFALGTAPVFIGFLEMMAREQAGLPKPSIGRDWSIDRA